MAFPGTPNNFYLQQGNLQTYLSWDISTGSTSYNVYRSEDGVNYVVLASPVLNNYTDTTVSTGVAYYYQVTAVNGGGESPATPPQSIIVAPVGEMSLGQIRQMSQNELIASTHNL
jgi:fibronectin type 3 domain-containing protein